MKKEDIKLIDKYLHSSLDEEEQRLLSERKKDLEFAKEFTFQKDVQSAATKLGREQLKQRLQKRENSLGLRIAYRKWLAVAASVLILMAAGSFWYAQTAYSNSSLLAEFYDMPNFSTSRSANEIDVFNQAAMAFYAQDYSKTIDVLKPLLTKEPNRNDAQLLLAHAYLKNNQSRLSLDLGEKIKNTERLTPEWEWLEVMAYLQAGEEVQLNERLSVISSNKAHPFNKEALELETKLSRLWRRVAY